MRLFKIYIIGVNVLTWIGIIWIPVSVQALSIPGSSDSDCFVHVFDEYDPEKIKRFRRQISAFISAGIFNDVHKPPVSDPCCILPVYKTGTVYFGHIKNDHANCEAKIYVPKEESAGHRVRVRAFFKHDMPSGLEPQWVLGVGVSLENELLYRFTQHPTYLKTLQKNISLETLVRFIRNGVYTDRSLPPLGEGPVRVKVQQGGFIYLGMWEKNNKQHIAKIGIKGLKKNEVVIIRARFELRMPFDMKPQWVLDLELPDGKKLTYRFTGKGTYLLRLEQGTEKEHLVMFVKRGVFTDPHIRPLKSESISMTVMKAGCIPFGSWMDGKTVHRVRINIYKLREGQNVIIRPFFTSAMPNFLEPQWVLELTLPDKSRRTYRFTKTGSHLRVLERSIRPHDEILSGM
ncbi:MAG: hypothetical protein GF384_03910 [Elusimicrobia bacterium]|nr:hypothetical protein [Elusimicrobiota bacterium]